MAVALLSSTYFGPVQWYQKLNRFDTCLIERYDHFCKQAYRNRCVIATTNGLQALSIPIKRYDGPKCLMRDIRISDHADWRRLHWNALLSAYGESPFFDFYADDLQPFFTQKWNFLFDFNLAITHKMCELLDLMPSLKLTDEYVNAPRSTDISATSTAEQSTIADFRDAIRPKHPLPDADFQARRYYQVYEQKHGFQPNLSILDLLFNQGNEAILYL